MTWRSFQDQPQGCAKFRVAWAVIFPFNDDVTHERAYAGQHYGQATTGWICMMLDGMAFWVPCLEGIAIEVGLGPASQ